MSSSILAGINLVVMLFACALLGSAIAQAYWRQGGAFPVILLIIVSGQVWWIAQAVSFFGFHSTRLLYSVWFGNWIVSAFAVVLLGQTLRGTSRHLLEAARLDGSGALATFRHVIWPTVRRPLAILALLLVMTLWAEFVRPLLPAITASADQLSFPQTSQDVAIIIALSLVATMPVIGVFLLSRRHFGAESPLVAQRG